ncbi:hypothetical protein jhhlp_001288 [Lomentospora prolificans]|uniref:PNPLA domain-containing protein n=1 Tax=Lomentospora prolificans TaxID=41688 RepID=A0A2N3NI13_9PEZI|nr:hypothetical protein jhhlp_001288 [Lomentospora prolificans]
MFGLGIMLAVWQMILDVVGFWWRKLWQIYYRRSPVELWLHHLRTAETFEDWEEAALHLDNLLGLDLWRNNPTSKFYDYGLINQRLNTLVAAREENDLYQIINLLRSGLVRNLGNITTPKLYNKAFAGTKYLIEEYIAQIAECIEEITALPTVPACGGQGLDNGAPQLTTQMKLDFIHDTRQAFGRSTLVLQGGAVFGLCHLGVVKALFLRGLLPRIITGTGTGALIAALVSIHTEEELPRILKGDGIDLSAFAGKATGDSDEQTLATRWATLKRRVNRFLREGHFLDAGVLEECVRANTGDLTFEEAYNRSKRILNITVAIGEDRGVPTLMNYLTTPNVLIWTAAVASNASSTSLYGHRRTTLLCKDAEGNIVDWAPPGNTIDFRHWSQVSYADRESPLLRVAELLNVTHFIVSQARPYIIPFLQSDMDGPSLMATRSRMRQMTSFLVRMVGLEVRHRLRQLDTLHLLPGSIRRFLVDERVPGASLTLVPQVNLADFGRLLEQPTRETLDYWILKGERSVYQAVAALMVRCAVENELDRSYQIVRRLKAYGLRRKTSTATASAMK